MKKFRSAKLIALVIVFLHPYTPVFSQTIMDEAQIFRLDVGEYPGWMRVVIYKRYNKENELYSGGGHPLAINPAGCTDRLISENMDGRQGGEFVPFLDLQIGTEGRRSDEQKILQERVISAFLTSEDVRFHISDDRCSMGVQEDPSPIEDPDQPVPRGRKLGDPSDPKAGGRILIGLQSSR